MHVVPDENHMNSYMKEVLPIKLDMEMLYVERQSFGYDCQLVWRTIVTILQVLFGKKKFKEQPELAEVRRAGDGL